jgi:L-rhamnose 1-dehydrogenase
MLLKDKVVIITGASRGIGRAVAIGCAREGADVVINYLSGPGAQVVEEIRTLGRRAVPAEGDVADPETGKRMVAVAVDAFGKLDVLVSNAGICPFHTFLDMPADVMRRTNEVNYYGTFYVTQAAANQMVAQGKGGAIVAMSSISALVGGGMQTHYTPTKAAIHSLMQSCAIALGPHGIRCNSVLAGTVRTDINREDLSDLEKVAYFTKGSLGNKRAIWGSKVDSIIS